MKILITSDWHFNNYKAHSRLIDGVNSRLLDLINAFKESVKIGKENGCEAHFICGDIFHVRGNIKPSVYNTVADLFATMAKELPIYMISGNHDLEDFKSTIGDAIYTLGKLDNVHLINYERVNLGGLTIAGVPYIHNIEKFKAEAQNFRDVDILLIHEGIDDLRTKEGIPETHLTKEFFKDFNFVITGHYHNPNFIDGILQAGSPIQLSFGEEGQDKGCWVLDTDNYKVRFYKLHYPEFITITPASLKDIKEEQCNGKIVRITAKDNKKLEKYVERALELGAISVKGVFEKEYKHTYSKTIKITTPEQMIAEYIDITGKYKDIKDDILNVFAEICY